MVVDQIQETPSDVRLVRSETLARLHWLAIFGQLITVLVIALYFKYAFAVEACLIIIGVSILLNLFLYLPQGRWLSETTATEVFVFDAVQFFALVYLTGGISNPFSMMGLAPVMVAASILSARNSLIVATVAILATTLVMWFHHPLPWKADSPLLLPPLYVFGLWVSFAISVLFVGFFTWRIAQDGRQLSQALAATELVLSREQHLSQLDGLAAAAAHELSTPLGTIALIAKELSKSAAEGSEAESDLKMLREQVERCRGILQKMTSFKIHGGDFFELVTMRQILAEIVQSRDARTIAINISAVGDGPEPFRHRNPGLTYALSNLIDNAIDFAQETV
ncbi:MAG: ActS/PrrB/RegB family redox-sensitive histidine kinase, partial [Methylobacteriaceae bacterium]|nr:ActS/PrrB/RegB family redox-sensitive histidine kinase [Methylobacteriaceae bacterium]